MARSSSGGGSRFASANLNDLYGKQVHSGIGGGGSVGKSRYAHSSHSHGGMLVLARPVRTPPGHHRSKGAQPKLTVPAPVNLPSLRKEHAGNDPNISLVGGSGVSGWKQQQSVVLVEDPTGADASGSLRSNGWGVTSQGSQSQSLQQSGDGQLRPSKYTPPGARSTSVESPLPIRHAPPPPSMFLRGEDFPTLRDALPFNPVPSQQRQRDLQQRQRDRQREMKEQQQKLQQLSQNQAGKEQSRDWSPPLTLQPQAKLERTLKEDGYNKNQDVLKENRKPNDLSLRPSQFSHASNWADDERDTGSVSRPPDWEEGTRYSSSQRAPLYRDERLDRVGNTRRDNVYNRDGGGDYGRGRDFGWEREGHFGRNDFSRDWNTGRTGYDRSEMDVGREHNSSRDFRGNGWGQREGYVSRDGRGRESYLRDDFFSKSGLGDRGRFGGRGGGFDFGMDFGRLRNSGHAHGMAHSEDVFMRDFPELASLEIRGDTKNRMKKKREEVHDIYYHDPERESFETELERVQKEQEQERQRKLEERERATELARKEQEDRERAAREEEERRRRLEEEAQEAAARAEQEVLETARKMEEAKRVRDLEKQKMQEEEERRKENARRKLMELEERIAKREMEKKQVPPQVEGDDFHARLHDDDRLNSSFLRAVSSPLRSRGHQDFPGARLRSPDMHNGYGVGRELGSRGADRFSSPWRKEGDGPFSPNVAHDHAEEGYGISSEAEGYYANFAGERRDRTAEKWLPNGDVRNPYSPRNALIGQSFLDREERWNRRGRDSRPFSPPSPTYGNAYDEGVLYGRLRQSLPKQPRVPPPPMRTSLQKQSLNASNNQPIPESSVDETTRPGKDVAELTEREVQESVTEEDGTDADSPSQIMTSEQSDKHMVNEHDNVAESNAAVDTSEDDPLEEKHVVEAVVDEQLADAETFSEDRSTGLNSPKVDSSENDNLEEALEEEVSEAVQMGAELAELVDSLIVLPKADEEAANQVKVTDTEELEARDEEVPVEGQLTPSPEPAALLPSPMQALQPGLVEGKNQVFSQPTYMPSQMPLLEPRPRLQSHPDRPMTLQFGLLPGTSLLQGSVPAIQIGSIQMPLQLHPPIGHHVTHMQPPQFQFGQIGQQHPMMPSFTVHPQAMLQHIDGPPMGAPHGQGIPGHQFHLQPHPDRTFWTHQYGQFNQQHNQPGPDVRSDKEQTQAAQVHHAHENETGLEHPVQQSSANVLSEGPNAGSSDSTISGTDRASREGPGRERRRQSRRDFKASNHAGHYIRKSSKEGNEESAAKQLGSEESQKQVHGDEDYFIEVRSKRQLLNERREEKGKQLKSKAKSQKVAAKPREQATVKQKNVTKPQAPPLKHSLSNFALDEVVSAVRPTQPSLSKPEVAYEKRTKSGQPLQKPSLVADVPTFPPFTPDGQSAPNAWGYSKEVVNLTQIQLEEAMKRFDPQQPSVPEPISATKEKGPTTGQAPINSLLAGEKIQFGAVTMSAFVSPISWPLGSSRGEDFLGSGKEEAVEVAAFDKGKRPRDAENGASNAIDSEAEAEAAASAIAVAAISSDDFGPNSDMPSLGVIGSASNKGSPVTSSGSPAVRSTSGDEPMSVSLPADLSVDNPLPLRGHPHSGQHLPGGFPGMEMGTILGGPVFPFNSAGDNAREPNASTNVEQSRPGPGPNWPHHSGVDSFYGGPPSYAGPFINHGPLASIPPQTLVYTNPFGVGQFGQLGVSYMGPMPSVKQPDWKHTPASTGITSGQHGNRHMGHDPNVISVVPPPGPFDIYRDVAFQVPSVDLQWSHIPGPHLHNGPGFAMQLRHPPPPFHLQQQQQQPQQQHQHQQHQQQQQQQPPHPQHNNGSAGELTKPAADQFPDELGLVDPLSTASEALGVPPKAPIPVSSPPTGGKLRSRVVRPQISGSESASFQFPAGGVGATAQRPHVGHSEKRNAPQQQQQQQYHQQQQQYHQQQQQYHQQQQGLVTKMVSVTTGWGSQGKKNGASVAQGQGRTVQDKQSGKLKQVYVVKPSSLGLTTSSESDGSFTAEARQT